MSREITLEELDQLALGAWILGTGGGGDPYHGLLNIKRLYAEGYRARLMPIEDVADEARIGVVSQMGAPLVSTERITDPAMIAAAVRLMEDYLGARFDALMALEIGGGNSIQPLVAGALLGRPVVDGDGMGRAYPSVFNTSFAVGGLTSTPFAFWDIRGNGMVITEAEDWQWVERISRRVCMETGARGFTCKAPRTGREVKDWGIPATVSQAIAIGRALQAARAAHADPIAAVLAETGGRRLFTGKVVDVERRMTGSYLFGEARFEGLDEDQGAGLRLAFQNEFLIAWRDGAPVAMVPDLITVLDSVSGQAIGTETLRYGQRITVIGLRAPAVFQSERGLQHAGPVAFGYELPYRPLFPGTSP